MDRRKRSLPSGWYPFDGEGCKREIESHLEGWTPSPLLAGERRGGILPHAGWYFSGRIATRVLHSLKSIREVDALILYGGHLGPEGFPQIVMEETCETPFGDIEIHTEFVKSLMKRIEIKKESPSSGDNTIEVQLAIVKYFFPKAKLVAIRMPHSLKAKMLGEAVAEISRAEGISIVAIGSTDLTHYGPNYGFLKKGIACFAFFKVQNLLMGFIIQM